MNKQDKQEPDNQQSVIEDLTVNDARTTEIKGGDGTLKKAGPGNLLLNSTNSY